MSAPRGRSQIIAATIAVVAVVAAAAFVGWLIATSTGEDAPADELNVSWVDREGHPGCVYDPASGTVEATLEITGESSKPQEVTVTVTAYADENTSQPVGSHGESVRVDGTVDAVLRITVPVDSTPHVGEDDVAACSREVQIRE